jgi:hypothetical protein
MEDFEIKNGVLKNYIGKKSCIRIPYGVRKIGIKAFYKCSDITSIEIPNSVIAIGDYAFSFCSNLTHIEIPNSVTWIGDSAFKGCTRLLSIKIPNGVLEIREWTFFNCTSLTHIEIPNSVTRIWNSAFDNCTSLISIKFPKSLTRISLYAFSNCTRLENIEIPTSVEIIDNFAFYKIRKVKPQYTAKGKMRAFKAFNSDWTCRDFQYAVGKSFHQNGKINCCFNGFHACPNPLAVFNYYYGELKKLRFAEVELSGKLDYVSGKLDYDTYDKVAASEIRIVRELTATELAEIYNSMEKEIC